MSGTISISFGTTFKGSEYAVACENGTVRVVGDEVIVERDGKEEKKKFEGDGNGVMQEVKAWAEGLVNGEVDPRQAPEEALKDLMVVCFSSPLLRFPCTLVWTLRLTFDSWKRC